MAKEVRARGQVLKKLRSKYRLLLINDRTFEERFSIRLSRLNVILLFLGLFTLHGLFVAALIVLTPLKRYIPGYTDQAMKFNAYRSAQLADSLQQVLTVRDLYIDNLRDVLSGTVKADSANLFRKVATPPGAADLLPGEADSVLRERIRREEQYAVNEGITSARGGDLAGLIFFPPIRGLATSTFEQREGHYGVDIVTKANEAVKATLDGTVVFASWTSDGGHVLQVQHRNDLVSVYKHNSVLLRKAGDKVKAGEAIAIVGNSGELTTGPHLHFELWYKGEPVDPMAYMVFK
ncbi:MAG: M23 family metallopeptidase [Flavobacteriales bacterium]|nr:M23 family metallopeptidase [Flavobacteriales bacterium]